MDGNDKAFLSISDQVKVIDSMGTMVADKLLFDFEDANIAKLWFTQDLDNYSEKAIKIEIIFYFCV